MLQELSGAVTVSIMAESMFPVMKTYNGSLENVIAEMPAFLAEVKAKWEVK